VRGRVTRDGNVSADPDFIGPYFFSAATTLSPGNPNARTPFTPVIVSAASIALTTASSVASIVLNHCGT
jgi:hypothetical protein